MVLWPLLLALLAVIAPSAAQAVPDAPADALRAIDARARALEAVRYSVIRTTLQNEASREERWVFAGEPGGHFRVDYVGDTSRLLACDGKTLWDYVPALNAAQRVDLLALPADERARTLANVLGKVSIPGIRTGLEAADMSTVAWGPEGNVGGRPTRSVVATDERGGKLTWVIDAEHGYLVSSTIEQLDVFVVSTEGSRWREIAPDLWVPMKVVSTSPAPGGKVRVELDLLQVVVGEDLPDHLFQLKLASTVAVRDLP